MAQTNLMRADEIVAAFNGATERQNWRATIAGNRVNPEVNFNSRANMVCVTYRIAHGDFTVSFSKTSAAFGDFLGSAYRSLAQIMGALKASGLDFPAVVDETNSVLRIGYDPRAKAVFIHIANHGDVWQEVEPAPFKVPVRAAEKIAQDQKNPLLGIDL